MADSQNDKITLTLDGAPKPELKLEPEEETAITIPKGDTEMDESNFTEEEKKMVEEFSETIDLRNSAVVLQYGASSQKKSQISPNLRWRAFGQRIWGKSVI